jgi:hypothetical protein
MYFGVEHIGEVKVNPWDKSGREITVRSNSLQSVLIYRVWQKTTNDSEQKFAESFYLKQKNNFNHRVTLDDIGTRIIMDTTAECQSIWSKAVLKDGKCRQYVVDMFKRFKELYDVSPEMMYKVKSI